MTLIPNEALDRAIITLAVGPPITYRSYFFHIYEVANKLIYLKMKNKTKFW